MREPGYVKAVFQLSPRDTPRCQRTLRDGRRKPLLIRANS